MSAKLSALPPPHPTPVCLFPPQTYSPTHAHKHTRSDVPTSVTWQLRNLPKTGILFLSVHSCLGERKQKEQRCTWSVSFRVQGEMLGLCPHTVFILLISQQNTGLTQFAPTFHFNHCFSSSDQSLRSAKSEEKDKPLRGETNKPSPKSGAGIHCSPRSQCFLCSFNTKALPPLFWCVKERGHEEEVRQEFGKHRASISPLNVQHESTGGRHSTV